VTLTIRDTDEPTRVLVIVDVVPGLPRVLQRRFFYVYGATPRELEAAEDSYGVNVGSRLDEARIEAADTELEARLHAQGRDRARVTHDVVVALGWTTLRVRIEAGPKFVMRYEGNDHFDRDALDAVLGLESENDRSPGHLVQKLRDHYIKHGFLDAEVAVETRGQPEAFSANMIEGRELPEVMLVFHVHRALARGRSLARVPVSQAGRDSAFSREGVRPRPRHRQRDRQLPRGRAPRRRPHPQPRSAGNRDPRRRAERGADGVTPSPDRPRSGRCVQRRHLRPRSPARPGALPETRAFSTRKWVPPRFCVAGATRARPPASAGRSPLERTSDACTYDDTHLPLPVAPLDPELSCTPDRARGVTCEPRLWLRIPVKLGPRTKLYDLSFSGAHSIEERRLATSGEIELGQPANVEKLDDARRRILDAYKEEGFAYADVKYALEESLDHTRARANFIVNEGDRVLVRSIVIRGNEVTNSDVIRRRIALIVGRTVPQQPRTQDARTYRDP